MSWLYNWFGIGNPPSVTVDVPRRTDYPTREEAQWLRSIDATYGEPVAGYLEREVVPKKGGQPEGILSQQTLEQAARGFNYGRGFDPSQNRGPMNADTQDRLYQAWAASQRSPLLALGFDPSRMVITNDKRPTTIEGAYSPLQDSIWANVGIDPSTVNHEVGHRGNQMMRQAGMNAPSQEHLPGSDMSNEEGIIRAVMQKYFPGRETDEQAQHISKRMKSAPEGWDKSIDAYEKGALSLYMQNRRKMGPN